MISPIITFFNATFSETRWRMGLLLSVCFLEGIQRTSSVTSPTSHSWWSWVWRKGCWSDVHGRKTLNNVMCPNYEKTVGKKLLWLTVNWHFWGRTPQHESAPFSSVLFKLTCWRERADVSPSLKRRRRMKKKNPDYKQKPAAAAAAPGRPLSWPVIWRSRGTHLCH